MLTGLMGAGKSSVAAAVARLTARPLVDLDRSIETSTGSTIAALFRDHGEPHFRALEADALDAALGQGAVVALGGGAFTTPSVRELCRQHGAITVYLHAAPSELLGRLGDDDRAARPLLANDAEAEMARLYRERDPIYRTADVVVETAEKSVDEIAHEVVDVW